MHIIHMKTNTTKNQLLNYHKQIQGMKGTIYEEFHAPKIREFYRNNGIRIDGINHEIDSLKKSYFVIEDDKIKFEKTEEGKNQPVLQDGKTMDEYNKALTDLLNTETIFTS